MGLSKLILETVKKYLKRECLIKVLFLQLLHEEWIDFLKRENKSRNFDQIKNYYMQRKLRRFIQIDKRKLESKKADHFMIVQTEEEYNEKCRQNPPEMKNGHYLIQDQSIQNHVLWRKSNGPISTLKEFLIKNEECEESIDEKELFDKNKDKMLIIAAEPGMGKYLFYL